MHLTTPPVVLGHTHLGLYVLQVFLVVPEDGCEVHVRVEGHVSADPLAHTRVQVLQLLEVLQTTGALGGGRGIREGGTL